MNGMILLLSLLIILTQLADAYLRCLAFHERMSSLETQALRRKILLWAALCLPLYVAVFRSLPCVAAYKFLLMAGWIPYLAIFIGVLRSMFRQHIYVFGMSDIWSFMQHNWSSILVALFLADSSDLTILLVHVSFYLLWFAFLLPWEKRIFSNLLRCPEIFEERPLGGYLVLLPLVLLAPPLILMADGVLWHSWEERLSRLYLPLVFFLLYRYHLSAAQSFYEFTRRNREAKYLREEISSLRDDAAIRQRELALLERVEGGIIRDCQTLEAMILAGQRQAAIALLKERAKGIHSSVLQKFSDEPLVNAVISIYLAKANDMGILFHSRVNLPETMQVKESDLAVLLSNLLENALEAAGREVADEGGISLTIQHDGRKCALAMTNPCTKPLRLGRDGLPRTERSGHGTGMISLKMFLEKYRGYAAFTQEEGRVRLLMYWRDEAPC